ncbi:hypothetical protein FJZ40_00185 [Candidatus Shapirobacteria bacterium]|nr:hypothetical protein [Candidatus Shapirobacteria bacterium]
MREAYCGESKSTFKSSFLPSPLAEKVLREGRIIGASETPQMMIKRMVEALFVPETCFGTSTAEIQRLIEDFGFFLDGKYCVMSTPVMTNAGRYTDRPLSACAVPPLDLRGDLRKVKQVVDEFHQAGMGTGFNLNDTENPVEILGFLNGVAVDGANSGKENRPVGNMAILSIHHPRILEFIETKVGSDERGENWKFNISIDVSPEFMCAVGVGEHYRLSDGTYLNAREVMYRIAESAVACGDPGLVFLDRFDRDNPTPGVGAYVG